MRGEPQAETRALPVSGRSECQKAHVLMSKFIDQELDPADLPTLKHHLDACETCRLQMKGWKDSAAVTATALKTLWRPKPIRVSLQKK